MVKEVVGAIWECGVYLVDEEAARPAWGYLVGCENAGCVSSYLCPLSNITSKQWGSDKHMSRPICVCPQPRKQAPLSRPSFISMQMCAANFIRPCQSNSAINAVFWVSDDRFPFTRSSPEQQWSWGVEYDSQPMGSPGELVYKSTKGNKKQGVKHDTIVVYTLVVSTGRASSSSPSWLPLRQRYKIPKHFSLGKF